MSTAPNQAVTYFIIVIAIIIMASTINMKWKKKTNTQRAALKSCEQKKIIDWIEQTTKHASKDNSSKMGSDHSNRLDYQNCCHTLCMCMRMPICTLHHSIGRLDHSVVVVVGCFFFARAFVRSHRFNENSMRMTNWHSSIDNDQQKEQQQQRKMNLSN